MLLSLFAEKPSSPQNPTSPRRIFCTLEGKGLQVRAEDVNETKRENATWDWPVIIRPINKDLQENLHLKSF